MVDCPSVCNQPAQAWLIHLLQKFLPLAEQFICPFQFIGFHATRPILLVGQALPGIALHGLKHMRERHNVLHGKAD